MSSRSIAALAVVVVVAAACNGTGPNSRTASSDAASSSNAAASSVAAAALPGGGRLVIVDGGGDIVTMRRDGTERHAFTTDGSVVEYRQPLWSPTADDLVWAANRASGAEITISDGTDELTIPQPSLPFFAMWSPDGSRVGVLHDSVSASGSIDLEIVDIAAGTSSVASSGAPFFFSWSPDGAQIVAHVANHVLELVASEGRTRVGETTGEFATPAWTDAGVFTVESGALVVRDGPDAAARPVVTVTGPATIVAAPGGNRLAVQVAGPSEPGIFASFTQVPSIPAGAVVVVDPVSGQVEVASGRTSFGFFWSPDGTSLLMLVPGIGEGEVEWWVWRDGEITNRVGFVPTASLVRDLVPFFDQYAQAWRPWAPDSSAFGFVGGVDGKAGVWVQDLDSSEPRFLSEGNWVAWSAR